MLHTRGAISMLHTRGGHLHVTQGGHLHVAHKGGHLHVAHKGGHLHVAHKGGHLHVAHKGGHLQYYRFASVVHSTDYALLYNDRAVLENYHINRAFTLLKEVLIMIFFYTPHLGISYTRSHCIAISKACRKHTRVHVYMGLKHGVCTISLHHNYHMGLHHSYHMGLHHSYHMGLHHSYHMGLHHSYHMDLHHSYPIGLHHTIVTP